MNKLKTGILSVFIAADITAVYVPNVMATILSDDESLGLCGNEADGQKGNSAAGQEAEQGQGAESGAQSVSPEFNALTANNLGLQTQQNGECIPTIDQPPVGDSTIPGITN
jgi:hypothetical protein